MRNLNRETVSRRGPNAAGLIVFTLVLFALSIGCESTPKPPNILFIFSDDHAYQAISAYGSTINQTPHIDRLAREGMIFNRCYVTNSICAPSRAVIQTGKYSHLNPDFRFDDRLLTDRTLSAPLQIRFERIARAVEGDTEWVTKIVSRFSYHSTLI